jgi:hypothetical protein
MNRWWAVSALCMAPLALFSIGMTGRSLLADTSVPTVVILRPGASDEVTTEAVARVRGELKAAGFEVAMLPLSSNDPRHDLETAGRELHPIAAFAIFVKPWEAGSSVAEIWVTDRVKQKTIIQNAVLHDTDRGRGSEILAVRAVELLKASLADFWAPETPKRPAPAPPASSARPPASAPESEPPPVPFASGFGVGLGAGAVMGFDPLDQTMGGPEATVSYGWLDGWSLRAMFHGFLPVQPSKKLPAATGPAPTGTALVEQQLITVEVVKAPWPTWRPVVPFISAGGGVQHVHVTGGAMPGFVSNAKQDWSAGLTMLGIGVGIPIISRLSLLLEARGTIAWPPTDVAICAKPSCSDPGDVAARVGHPSIMMDGGFMGVFP